MNFRNLPLLLLLCLSAACQPATTVVVPTATIPPTAQPTYTATVKPSPTVTATPTLEPTATPCPPLPTPEATQFSEPRSIKSPDGVWTMTLTGFGPTLNCSGLDEVVFERVTVSNGEVEWTLIDQWEGYGLGSGGYEPFYWSADGERLYFTYVPVPDGCQGFVNGESLWRVELADGTVKRVFPGGGLWLSLSPNETQVAYIGYGQRGLVIHDLATQAEVEIPLLNFSLGYASYTEGRILWSPDESSIVLTIWRDYCSPPFAPANTAIIHADLQTGEARVILENETQGYITTAWPSAENLQVSDNTGKVWRLNPTTGELLKP